jgi:hypothetical protein
LVLSYSPPLERKEEHCYSGIFDHFGSKARVVSQSWKEWKRLEIPAAHLLVVWLLWGVEVLAECECSKDVASSVLAHWPLDGVDALVATAAAAVFVKVVCLV